MSKHTEGPWKIGKGSFIISEHPTSNTLGSTELSLKYYDGYLICESVHSNNLNLIAAAPELLEILKLIIDSTIIFPSNIENRIIQIIAKAEGK